MMKESFLKHPYIPKGELSLAAAGEGVKPFLSTFSSMHINVELTEPIQNVNKPIALHADCALCSMGEGTFIIEKSQKTLRSKLQDMGAIVYAPKQELQNAYPFEAALNAVLMEKIFLCNTKTVDSFTLGLAKSKKYDIINCNQGYAKCSTAPVTSTACITDDESIARVLAPKMDVLQVRKGDVQLHGYAYGFIGGACSMVAKDCMLFFGNAKKHRDYDEICSFLRNYNIYIDSASTMDLQDIGGIVPILERSV